MSGNLDTQAAKHQVNTAEWCFKFIGHVMGGSALLLPYSMGRSGIILFELLLILELYVTGNSLIQFCEMAVSEEGIDHVNYFNMVESHLGGGRMVRYAIRCTYFCDFIICSAIYFKLAEELILDHLDDMIKPRDRPAYCDAIFLSIALFLVISEFVLRCTSYSRQQHQSDNVQVNIKHSQVGNLRIEHSSQGGNNRWKLNLNDVVQKLHGYSKLRFFLLLLFFFLGHSLISSFWTIWKSHEFLASNYTQCPGLLEPFLWPSISVTVLPVMSTIIFALMHYSIFLPICLEELKLPVKEYSRLVRIASIILLVILTVIPLLAHFTFGESAPVLFTSGYGRSVYGMIFFFLTLVITLIAMLLRINGCCKLVQVLFGWESSSHSDIITICVFLFAMWVVSMARSVLYLVIIAGSVSCNLLLIILPRVAYIRFKRGGGEQWTSVSIFPTLVCAIVHGLLLLSVIPSLIFADLDVGQRCCDIFNQF